MGIKCYLDQKYNLYMCDEVIKHKYPKIIFNLGGYELDMEPSDYVVCDPTICAVKLSSAKISNFLILGDAFMQSYYVSFDQEEKLIGFAKAKK